MISELTNSAGRRPGKGDDSSFAGAVVGLPHRRDLAVQRADDPTVTLGGHNRDGRRGAVKAPVEICLNHLAPLLIRHSGKHRVAGDTCILHKDVQMTELFGDLLDHRPGQFRISDTMLTR